MPLHPPRPRGSRSPVGDGVVLRAGEQPFLEEQFGDALGAGRVRKIGVERGIAKAAGALDGDKRDPPMVVEVADQLAQVALRIGMNVEVLKMNDESARGLILRLPRLRDVAERFRDGE